MKTLFRMLVVAANVILFLFLAAEAFDSGESPGNRAVSAVVALGLVWWWEWRGQRDDLRSTTEGLAAIKEIVDRLDSHRSASAVHYDPD